MDSPRAVHSDDASHDVTDALNAYGREIGTSIGDSLSGYILKAKSPSCGMERVKVYGANGIPTSTGAGIYAHALMTTQPLLPMEEEGRLRDECLRDNFVERVFVYHQWRHMLSQGITPKRLITFHSEHKFLVLAHQQQAYAELGRLVARAGEKKTDLEELSRIYIARLMQALGKPASRKNHTNVLQHMAGYFKKHLDASDKA